MLAFSSLGKDHQLEHSNSAARTMVGIYGAADSRRDWSLSDPSPVLGVVGAVAWSSIFIAFSEVEALEPSAGFASNFSGHDGYDYSRSRERTRASVL